MCVSTRDRRARSEPVRFVRLHAQPRPGLFQGLSQRRSELGLPFLYIPPALCPLAVAVAREYMVQHGVAHLKQQVRPRGREHSSLRVAEVSHRRQQNTAASIYQPGRRLSAVPSFALLIGSRYPLYQPTCRSGTTGTPLMPGKNYGSWLACFNVSNFPTCCS